MLKRCALVSAMAVSLLLVAGCGSDDAETTATSAPAGDETTTTAAPTPTTSDVAVEPNGETFTIQAVDNSFVPEETTVAAGTEVIWENRGRNDHNIIPEDPDAAWRVDADAFGPTAISDGFVFTRAGTYRFYCSIHGTIDAGMPGVLIVE